MRLAIFGCGNIAKRIAASCLKVKEIDLVGFASKDIEKAKAYSENYGCADYGDYEHFLNGDIDAVYIAVYNPGHHELIKRCIEHHKNVICEKPMLFSVEENRELFAYAKKNEILLMEALKSVFLPSIGEVKRMMKEGEIGEIEEIYASFMRAGHHPESHWISNLVSGGAFKDLGSYCVGTMNYLMEMEPELLKLQSDRKEDHSETTAFADLQYGSIRGKATVSNSMDGDCLLRVKGSRGIIEAVNFWKQGKISYTIDGVRGEKDIEPISDFYYELRHFADLVDNGIKESPVMSEEASEKILKITGQIDGTIGDLTMPMETKRLILRHWKKDDAPEMFRYACDPDVGPIAGWPAHRSPEESEAIVDHFATRNEIYAICLKDDKPIGCIEIKLKESSDMTDRDDECELGYWLGKPFWGQGIMPEAARRIIQRAFDDLHMEKVWCGYYDGNRKSKRVQEKCGFRYMWTSEDLDVPLMHEKRRGHVTCMTKEEWNNLKAEEEK